jgi:nicotinate-nucleotide adenylyltransferase
LSRLGLLGGTFDPPHYGHLLAAQESAWRLELERVLFLPARQNPLKQGIAMTAAEVRCEMVRLAIHDDPRFELSRLDLDRSPPSYTVDLLRGLQQPGCELFFIVGGDILPELPLWYAPDEIFQLTHLAVLARPGAPLPDFGALERRIPSAAGRLHLVDMPGVDISSTSVRARVRGGLPIRYLTPAAVEDFIHARGLYRA